MGAGAAGAGQARVRPAERRPYLVRNLWMSFCFSASEGGKT